MLGDISGLEKIYIVCGYTDMRKSIDGLCAIIEDQLKMDPTSSALFLFCGRRRDRIKALFREPDGFVLIYKRLSVRGGYQWPRKQSEVRNLSWREFDWLMSGIDIDQPKALKQHISEVVDMSELLAITDTAPLRTAQVQKVQRQLDKKHEEYEKLQRLLMSLYENLTDDIIDREEYTRLKASFTACAEEAEKQMDALREQHEDIHNHGTENAWMNEFIKRQGLTSLDRAVVVALIDKILIAENFPARSKTPSVCEQKKACFSAPLLRMVM